MTAPATTPAPTWPRAWLTACAFATAFGLTYVVVDFAQLPRLLYHPHERTWRLTAEPAGALAMGYFGLWLWALVAGLVAGVVVSFAARGRTPSARLLGLAQAWAITALGLAGAYMTWHNWP